MKKTAVIAGLGLMGGSMAMAFKEHTDWTVCGWNRTRAVAEKALERGAIDAIADEQTIAQCDYTVLIPMSHGVDSLNVAAASAVAFWQLRAR